MVSVLLLSFNHAKFIEQAITSIITQTYKDIEVIYLDNASADESFAVAEALLKQSGVEYSAFKRDSVYKTAENFNFLLKNCNGSTVCLLSADDWMDKKNIEVKMKRMESDLSLAFVDSNGYKYYNELDIYEPISVCFEKEDPKQRILENNVVSGIGCVVKTEVLNLIGGWDESLSVEDWDLWIRIITKFPVACCEEKLFYYRQHVNGLSNNIDLLHKGKMETYLKHQHLNKEKTRTLEIIKGIYLSKAVMSNPSPRLVWNVAKNFQFKKDYVLLLIKSILPLSIKRKYLIHSLKKRNTFRPIP